MQKKAHVPKVVVMQPWAVASRCKCRAQQKIKSEGKKMKISWIDDAETTRKKNRMASETTRNNWESLAWKKMNIDPQYKNLTDKNQWVAMEKMSDEQLKNYVSEYL